MNYSIKRFLLVYISLAIILIYLLISLVSYEVSNEELNELYDANLQQVANTIVAQHLAIQDATHLYNNNQLGIGTQIEGEEDFYVRILAEDRKVLYVSHPDANVPLPSILGLSTQTLQKKQWRFFSIKVKGATIQVAQSLKQRKNTIKETAVSLIVSQILFIPFLVLLIFFAIRKALLPLNELTVEIKRRNSEVLEPFSDIKLPSEIKPLVQSLNMFIEKVSSMVNVLKRFTSDAAHELRTPITALKLQLSIVENAKTKNERESAIQNLKSGIHRSEKLISQLLTLARLEPNSHIREIQPINIRLLVKESIEELLPFAHEKYIDLGLSKKDDAIIYGVGYEIKILINNILDNAIRYTPNHGCVNVSIKDIADKVILEINDNGPGVLSNDLERVLERFYRGENNDSVGSGLGLAIVKEIALYHKATIELKNTNPGLSFKVIFLK